MILYIDSGFIIGLCGSRIEHSLILQYETNIVLPDKPLQMITKRLAFLLLLLPVGLYAQIQTFWIDTTTQGDPLKEDGE